jgi:hypothetical protein
VPKCHSFVTFAPVAAEKFIPKNEHGNICKYTRTVLVIFPLYIDNLKRDRENNFPIIVFKIKLFSALNVT